MVSWSDHGLVPVHVKNGKTKPTVSLDIKEGSARSVRESFLRTQAVSLPILSKPRAEERLWVYLTATEQAVGSVLLKEEGPSQKPIYYLSHMLKATEFILVWKS